MGRSLFNCAVCGFRGNRFNVERHIWIRHVRTTLPGMQDETYVAVYKDHVVHLLQSVDNRSAGDSTSRYSSPPSSPTLGMSEGEAAEQYQAIDAVHVELPHQPLPPFPHQLPPHMPYAHPPPMSLQPPFPEAGHDTWQAWVGSKMSVSQPTSPLTLRSSPLLSRSQRRGQAQPYLASPRKSHGDVLRISENSGATSPNEDGYLHPSKQLRTASAPPYEPAGETDRIWRPWN